VVSPPRKNERDFRTEGILNSVDLTDDPIIERSTKLIRLGAGLPPLGAILTLVVLRIVDGTSSQLAFSTGALVFLGELLVWTGMYGLWKSQGWASGVIFFLAVGGVLSAQTLYLTGIPVLMPIPLVAPLVAWWAKKRLQHQVRTGAGS
jgi:hypothetical protein